GLHAGRVPAELVVAEVRLLGSGRDDQAVVADPGRLGQVYDGDRAGVEVDAGDRAQPGVRVGLVAQHVTNGRGDLAFGEDAGGDLVEQRLEQVVVGPVHDRDVDR